MIPETKICQNCKQNFTIESEDFAFYEKMKVPAPTFCPRCRLQRRFMQRNERSLYKRTCDLCKKDIITMYSPDKPLKVYCPECYHSDKWDPLQYGRDYNPAKTFFEQYQELQREVPHLSLFQENVVNSPWVNYEMNVRNCYLCFGGHENEDCGYNQYGLKCSNCFDNYFPYNAQFSYDSIFVDNGYKVVSSILSPNCREAFFSFDCKNCSNIIGCTGLRHKNYHIFNKPVSKEEYESFKKEYLNGSFDKFQELKKKSTDFWKIMSQRALFIDKCVNCSGNLLKESKNCQDCWNTQKSEDSKYLFLCLEVKNSMDATSAWKDERVYEFLAGIELSNVRFSSSVVSGSLNIEYSHMIFACQNCLGCVNLKNKQYCILNKQYSKEEYNILRDKIISDMKSNPYKSKGGYIYNYGEFFPPEISPFGYNETVANEYFPIEKANALEKGYNWSDYESEVKYEFSDYVIPDKIDEVDDDILQKVLKCQTSGKAYRITKAELDFYKQMQLPIPRLSPYERHKSRLKFLSDHLNLLNRKCEKCSKDIKSVYSEAEFPKVLCNDCYQKQIS